MDRRREVLGALRRAPGEIVSGEALAERLGVSRAAVSKHVAALRETGYDIEAAPGAGYRLRSAPDAPVPDEVAELADSGFWGRFEGGGTTASTNDDAKSLARAGAAEGTVVLASEQTGGRGRLGRGWLSPPGGAYFSAILRPDVAAIDIAPLALVVALGVARGLEELGVPVSLKWPNDLLVGEDKLAGVLVETAAEADRVEWAVAGCGINARRPETEPPAAGAAFVEDVVEGAGPARVAASALDGLAGAYRDFLAGGFGPMLAEFERRHALTGEAATVSDAGGAVLASGRVSAVDEWGRLLVETADGLVALAAGEVTLG
jgi:BirA family biotin operon repressor/biotin-[acetyl-CoA-carboxylase] ligase